MEQQAQRWVVSGDSPLKLIEWHDEMSHQHLTPDTLVMASPDIDMREAIEIRYHTGNPILLMEENQLVGTLSDHDFYHALLGKYHQVDAA